MLKPHSRIHTERGPSQTTDEEQALLRSARTGDMSAVGRIYDLHGTAVFQLACVVVGDCDQAGAAVAAAMAEACSQHLDTTEQRTLRHILASLTYQRCHDAHPSTHDPSVTSFLGSSSDRQRAALGLVMYGELPVRQVAGLMGLRTQTVTSLLRAGLRELGDATKQAGGVLS